MCVCLNLTLLTGVFVSPALVHAADTCQLVPTSATYDANSGVYSYDFELSSINLTFINAVNSGQVTVQLGGSTASISNGNLTPFSTLKIGPFTFPNTNLEGQQAVVFNGGTSSCSTNVPAYTSSDPVTCSLTFPAGRQTSRPTGASTEYSYAYALSGSQSFGQLTATLRTGITLNSTFLDRPFTGGGTIARTDQPLAGLWQITDSKSGKVICSATAPAPTPLSEGAPYCDSGVFVIAPKNGDPKTLSIQYSSSQTHNFKDGTFFIAVQNGGTQTGTGNLLYTNTSNGRIEGAGGLNFTMTLATPAQEGSSLVISGVGDNVTYCGPYTLPTINAVGLQVNPFDYCKQANPADKEACAACFGPPGAPTGKIWTGIGCIGTTTPEIVRSLLTIGLGLSGGVVLLSILAGAFMLATSAGEPKKIQEAQEMISAAVIGLLFVIFSAIILRFIGVSILHIPGFLEK